MHNDGAPNTHIDMFCIALTIMSTFRLINWVESYSALISTNTHNVFDWKLYSIRTINMTPCRWKKRAEKSPPTFRPTHTPRRCARSLLLLHFNCFTVCDRVLSRLNCLLHCVHPHICTHMHTLKCTILLCAHLLPSNCTNYYSCTYMFIHLTRFSWTTPQSLVSQIYTHFHFTPHAFVGRFPYTR